MTHKSHSTHTAVLDENQVKRFVVDLIETIRTALAVPENARFYVSINGFELDNETTNFIVRRTGNEIVYEWMIDDDHKEGSAVLDFEHPKDTPQ